MMMLALMRRAITEFGKLRYLVSDHGTQFSNMDPS